MRLIATDLDGTLLGARGAVSPRTRRALDAARAAGILVVPVTARLPIGLQQLRTEAGFDGWALCSNAAVSVRLDTGEIGHEWHVTPAAARATAEALLRIAPDAVFASVRNVGWDFVAEAGYLERMSFADHKRDPALLTAVSRDDVLAAPSLKLVARGDGWDYAAMTMALREAAVPAVEVTFSGAPFVEIVGDGVTKASGLAALCARLGIAASDVVAFGDAHNDVEMLRWAGRGVAVANAVDIVRDAADEVTASNDEDGVAQVIERLL